MATTEHHGKVLLHWTFPEFYPHDRTASWLTGMILLTLALIGWAVYTANYLLAFIIIVGALIIALREFHGPETIQVQLSHEGIELGHRVHFLLLRPPTTFVPWDEIDRYWIVYKPPHTKKVYIHHKSMWQPLLILELEEQNPVEVRQVLGQYIDEDLEAVDEPFADIVSRWLKI